MSPLFELKVELRTFNSQKKCFKRHLQHVGPINVRGPASDIASCLIRMSSKINRTRHSLGVSVAKKYQMSHI